MTDFTFNPEPEVAPMGQSAIARIINRLHIAHAVMFVSTFLTIFALEYAYIDYSDSRDDTMLYIPVVCGIILLIELAAYIGLRIGISRFAAKIVRDAQPESIGLVLDCLDLPTSRHTTHMLDAKVLSLLKKLQDYQYLSVTPYQRDQLRAYLSSKFMLNCPDSNVVFELLDELSRLGDHTELETFRKLTRNLESIGTERDLMVHTKSCASTMAARLKAESVTGRLLRPASSDDIALLRPASAVGDILLQPATGPGFEDPHSLLRPAEPTPSDSDFKK